jgi:hypothetical protein
MVVVTLTIKLNSSRSPRSRNACTVRRWIVAGDLVVHRVGNVVRVSDGDLRARF